jgi:hypothetical protein
LDLKNFLKPRENSYSSNIETPIIIEEECLQNEKDDENKIIDIIQKEIIPKIQDSEIFKDYIIKMPILSFVVYTYNELEYYKIIFNIEAKEQIDQSIIKFGKISILCDINGIIYKLLNEQSDIINDIKYKPYDEDIQYLKIMNDLHLFFPYKTNEPIYDDKTLQSL